MSNLRTDLGSEPHAYNHPDDPASLMVSISERADMLVWHPDALDTTEDKVAQLLKDGGVKAVAVWMEKELRSESMSVCAQAFKAMAQFFFANGTKNAMIRCRAIASLAGITGKSQTALAAECGLTRAALNKEIVKLRDDLHVMVRGMRSEKARQSYRNRMTPRPLKESFTNAQSAEGFASAANRY